MSLLELTRKCTVTRDGVKSYLFHWGSSFSIKFAQVSSIWRKFVQQHSQRSRWRGYVRKCEEAFIEREKENHGTPYYQNSTSYDNLPRFPLSQLNLNSCQRQGQDQPNKVPVTPMPQICSSHSITPQIKNELRPCPKCTSPSTVSKSHNGHFQCRNQKCGLKFCPTCLRYTEQHVKSKICYGLSAAQKSEKDIIGRKKSRERLRRLWWKLRSIMITVYKLFCNYLKGRISSVYNAYSRDNFYF